MREPVVSGKIYKHNAKTSAVYVFFFSLLYVVLSPNLWVSCGSVLEREFATEFILIIKMTMVN